MRSIEIFIARRYLKSKRTVRFINLISYISIAGITAGVAALLIALSVFNGFNGVVTSVLVGFDPHLRIEKRGGITQPDLAGFEKIVEAQPQVQTFSPFISGKAMLVAGDYNKVVFVRGVDEGRIGQVTGLKDRIVLGGLELGDSTGTPGIVIGLALADYLGAVVDARIVAYSPSGIQQAVTGMGTPQSMLFRETGIFESNNRQYDAEYAYISVDAAQRLFDRGGSYDGVEIRLKNFETADEVKASLIRRLPGGCTVSTWYDLHRSLYSVMQVERWSAYLLLCLIILVATFNMLGSLTMGVIEKRRDIAVLKSMGMAPRSIVRVFMVEGMLIGIIGTVLGVLLGLVVLYLQMRYHLVPLDSTVYIIPAIPVEIRWTDFVAISAASLGLSFLAAYYPARRASATLPAEALRWE